MEWYDIQSNPEIDESSVANMISNILAVDINFDQKGNEIIGFDLPQWISIGVKSNRHDFIWNDYFHSQYLSKLSSINYYTYTKLIVSILLKVQQFA